MEELLSGQVGPGEHALEQYSWEESARKLYKLIDNIGS